MKICWSFIARQRADNSPPPSWSAVSVPYYRPCPIVCSPATVLSLRPQPRPEAHWRELNQEQKSTAVQLMVNRRVYWAEVSVLKLCLTTRPACGGRRNVTEARRTDTVGNTSMVRGGGGEEVYVSRFSLISLIVSTAELSIITFVTVAYMGRLIFFLMSGCTVMWNSDGIRAQFPLLIVLGLFIPEAQLYGLSLVQTYNVV